MLLGTAIVPLILQNTTQARPVRLLESVCQISTVVLSISSTTYTAADGVVSTSYSLWPVNKHISQAAGSSTTLSTASTAAVDTPGQSNGIETLSSSSSLSSSALPRSGQQSPLTTTSFSSSVMTGSGLISSAPIHSTDSSNRLSVATRTSTILPSTSDSARLSIPRSSFTRSSQLATTLSTAAESSINPVYTCSRDDGMFYSDTENRVYQLLCNTDEPQSTIGTSYQAQLQLCVDSCGEFAGCVGVSYTATTGLCSYKSSAFSRVGSSTSDSAVLADYICPGADGTRLVDSSGSVYEILCNTYFPQSNNITSSLMTTDLASCSEICSATSDCSGFTFQDGSCTLVSNRNSNDGVLRTNVATAILLAKRVVQVVSSGVTPYRSTSLVRSLPAEATRTPSLSVSFITFSGVVSETARASSLALDASSSSIMTNTGQGVSSGVLSIASISTNPDTAGPSSTNSVSDSRDLTRASRSTASSIPLTSNTLVVAFPITPTGSGMTSLSAEASSLTVINSSILSSIRSSATKNIPTIINRSSQTSTALLTSSLESNSYDSLSSTSPHSLASPGTISLVPVSSRTSQSSRSTFLTSSPISALASSSTATSGLSLLTISRSSVSTDSALLSSILISATRNDGSIVYRPTSVVSQAFPSSPSSSYNSAPPESSTSTLPPQTTYSCPLNDGDQVQANTGGIYTIGCDEETTGGGFLYGSATDFNECMTYCDLTVNCTAWTYNGNCYLKTGNSASDFSFQASTRGIVSGIRNVPARPGGFPNASSAPTASITPTASSVPHTSSPVSDADSISSTPLLQSTNSAISGEPTSSAISSVSSETSAAPDESPNTSTVTNSYPRASGATLTASDLGNAEILSSTESSIVSNTLLADTTSTPVTSGLSVTSHTGSSSTVFTSSAIEVVTSPSITPAIASTVSSGFVSFVTMTTLPCSIYDNVLDICLDGAITPSVGVGGGAGVGIGSSTITIIDASASLGIAPSVSASIDLGLSVGQSGIGLGASATLGAGVGLEGPSHSTPITSSPTVTCSAGGNVLDLCIDAAVTPSINVGGDAGVGVVVGSSTITLLDVSASLAIVPSVTAGVDVGLSIGSSGLGLSTNATIGIDLGVGASGSITVPPILPTTPTSTANCSAGGNVLNVCVDASITPSVAVSAGLNLNLGPSSSALTLLDVSASVGLAPSVAAGLDLGLSIGSSGIGLTPSATLGVGLGLGLGLGLGGSGSGSAGSSSPGSSVPSTTAPGTSAISGLNLGLTLGSGQPGSSSPTSSPRLTTSTATQGLDLGLGGLLSNRPASSTSMSSSQLSSATGPASSITSGLNVALSGLGSSQSRSSPTSSSRSTTVQGGLASVIGGLGARQVLSTDALPGNAQLPTRASGFTTLVRKKS